MKKILLVLAMFAISASAEVILGANVGVGKVNAKSNLGTSASASGVSFGLNAGYQWEKVRALVFLNSDKYSEDMLVVGEGNAVSYGAEVDYRFTDKVYAGLLLAKGTKDIIVTDADFNDVGLRIGYTTPINDKLSFDGSLSFKSRAYDEYMGIDVDEKLIGFTIGLNFTL